MNKSNLGDGRVSSRDDVSIGDFLRVLSFDRFYRIWSLLHAGILVVLVGLAEIASAHSGALAVLTAWCAFAPAVLFLVARSIHPDGSGPAIPNLLTATRVVGGVFFLFLVFMNASNPAVGGAARSGTGWFLVLGLVVVEITDFFDGRIARRMKAGAFGAVWDMESDVIYAIALAVALRHIHAVPVFVLLIGLMRPLYVLIWHYETTLSNPPRVYKWFSKTTTALIIIAMITAMAPAVGSAFRVASLSAILLLQLVSFGWDLVLQRGAHSRA